MGRGQGQATSAIGPGDRHGHGKATNASATGGSSALLGRHGLRYLHLKNILVPIFHSRPAVAG